MENNDLMRSLENMKNVLSDVKTANEQVQATVNAYNGLEEQVKKLVTEINRLSEATSRMIKSIQDDYQGKLKTITDDAYRIINSCEEAVRHLESSIDSFNLTIEQKMKEQEKYFINSTKWQKRIVTLLLTNIIVILALAFKIFVG